MTDYKCDPAFWHTFLDPNNNLLMPPKAEIRLKHSQFSLLDGFPSFVKFLSSFGKSFVKRICRKTYETIEDGADTSGVDAKDEKNIYLRHFVFWFLIFVLDHPFSIFWMRWQLAVFGVSTKFVINKVVVKGNTCVQRIVPEVTHALFPNPQTHDTMEDRPPPLSPLQTLLFCLYSPAQILSIRLYSSSQFDGSSLAQALGDLYGISSSLSSSEGLHTIKTRYENRNLFAALAASPPGALSLIIRASLLAYLKGRKRIMYHRGAI
ncbi:hypothetical protein NQ318_009012 [Aromia moschata]|uniref:Uncharacterized protein n=1 Tax=Aromia moschata TaxID=1265417 RepID=A0AAV8YUG7_9CUCU|nr:hypothetical protein NQ318_009012 [Aromia moschata]